MSGASPTTSDAPILEVSELTTQFHTRAGVVKAVDGVSFSLHKGEIIGLVGESGSGKSVTGFSLIGLVDPPGRIVSGSVKLDGQELVGLSPAALRKVRGARIAMVFQDPMMTLNPVLTIGQQMQLALNAHEKLSKAAARARSATWENAFSRRSILETRCNACSHKHHHHCGNRID